MSVFHFSQPHQEYRHVLKDFRETLFLHISTIAIVFSGVCGNIILLQRPVPLPLLGMMILLGVLSFIVRAWIDKAPDLSRYAYVVLLYLIFFASIILVPDMFLVFLIAPLLLVTALLMTNSAILGAFAFLSLLTALDFGQGRDYPLFVLGGYTVLCLIISEMASSTFNVALSWYSSMHRRADALLNESRERRAEVVQALKSLDIAYQTQQRLQQQLLYARKQADEARRLKERFASNISHELRTPLNIILGFSEIMYLTPEVYGDVFFPPKLHRDMYQIYRNSRHLLEMIDDVLDLSHIEMTEFSLNFEVTNLNEFLADTLAMMQNLFQTGDVEFISSIEADLPVIEIDRTRMRQVLINLLNNAQRFTEKGVVTFTVQQTERQILFSIADTGRGIPADKLQLIFEEFYQIDYSLSRKHGGAGLGLAITKRFVEAHKGNLQVESTEGVGSVFRFALPKPERVHYDGRKLQSSYDYLSKDLAPNILVLDNDVHTQSLLARQLENYELIQVQHLQDLAASIERYAPRAVIINRLPQQAPLPDMDIPLIECTLPSSQWMIDQLNVTHSFAKPVSLQQIRKLIEHLPTVRQILIVDDDMGFVQLLQRCIETLDGDYQIQRAYDGAQAYEAIQANLPDLLFLDLSMPELDGFQLLDLLKADERFKALPIVLLTATRYLQSDAELQSQVYLHKEGGFSPYETIQALKALLHSLLPV